jgi:uncharacterized protein
MDLVSQRVLVLCDDPWHPAALARTGLAPLEQQGFAFDYLENTHEFSEARLNASPVTILTKSNNASAADKTPWMNAEIEAAFVHYVRNGNGLLVIHSGSAGYEACATLRALMGGVFVSHPEQCMVTVEAHTGQALGEGAEPFTVKDEHYQMALDDDEANVFISTASAHGEQPGGWTRTEGAGRVAVLTPGHNIDVWLHESYQRLILNALRWCQTQPKETPE